MLDVGRVGQIGRMGSRPVQGVYVPGLDLDFVQGRYALAGPYGSAFPAGWSFSRTGAGLAQRADGTFVSFASGAPRITDRGLLVEEARTNLIPNSALAGTGGQNGAPNTWTGAGAGAAGITRTIVGSGVEFGLAYTDVRIAGTPATTGSVGYNTGPTVAFSPSTAGTYSFFYRLVSAIGGVALGTGIVEIASGVTNYYGANTGAPNSSLQRAVQTRVSAVGTTVWNGYFLISFNAGVPLDMVIRFYAPQLEVGGFATSPIITTGAAATRAADVATVTGLGSILTAPFVMAANVDMSAIDGMSRTLALANDGSINNAIRLQRNLANDIGAQATIANITQPTSSISGYTGARAIKSAVRSRATELRGSFDGVLAGNLTGQSTPPGLNRLDVGSFVGSSFVNGYIRRVQIIPGDMTDAQLQGLTS